MVSSLAAGPTKAALTRIEIDSSDASQGTQIFDQITAPYKATIFFATILPAGDNDKI